MRNPLGTLLPLLGPTANSLVTTTIAFTMTGGGEAVNVIPREAWVIGDMRCSHHQGKADSVREITKTADKFGIDVEITDESIESAVTDFNGKAFRLVEEAVAATLPHVEACAQFIMTGASDARFFGRLCGQCIRFQPLLISDEQMESIHGVNECLDADNLVPAVDYYRYMLTHV
jgi:carboxypeptidase PM20D1